MTNHTPQSPLTASARAQVHEMLDDLVQLSAEVEELSDTQLFCLRPPAPPQQGTAILRVSPTIETYPPHFETLRNGLLAVKGHLQTIRSNIARCDL